MFNGPRHNEDEGGGVGCSIQRRPVLKPSSCHEPTAASTYKSRLAQESSRMVRLLGTRARACESYARLPRGGIWEPGGPIVAGRRVHRLQPGARDTTSCLVSE